MDNGHAAIRVAVSDFSKLVGLSIPIVECIRRVLWMCIQLSTAAINSDA